jgi:MFS transporter, ACS family, hexuronate transporter
MTVARLRWIVLALLCLSTVINYIDRQALAIVLPQLRGELGLTSYDYGVVTTVFLLAYSITQIGSGVLVDRVGTRLGFIFSIVIWSAAAGAHAFATGVWSLIVLRCILGVGEAGNWPAGAKAIAEWIPRDRRAFALGVFDGGSAAGAVIAPPLVAALTLTFGWRTAFVAIGAAGFVWLAVWWAVYRKPSEHPWLSAAGKEQIAAETAEPVPRAKVRLVELLGQRKLWGLIFTRAMATPVWWFYVFWLPDYLSKERGLGLKEIGMFGWIPYLTVDFGKLLGGAVSDGLLHRGWSATLARKTVMAAAAVAMLGGTRVVGADSVAGALAWVSLATFGFGMWSANILALHTDIFPKSAIATAIGWTGAAASLGGAAFSWAAGWIVQTRGYGTVFWAVGTAAVLALGLLIVILGRVEPIRQAEVTA